MVAQISCPHCGQKINPKERICQQCGVDLAVATALAFQILTTPEKTLDNKPWSPEILVPRIGEVFVEQELLTPEQLQTALAYQKQSNAEGKSILIGQALLELNFVDQQTLNRVVTMQILQLQAALQHANSQLSQKVLEGTEAYQKALERIAELNQVKSNFLSAISHELRTPLTTIKGYLEILLQGDLGPVLPAQEDALKLLRNAEIKLEKLIDDLLNFSLASHGELNLKLRQVDIGTLIKSCAKRSREKIEKKNIQFSMIVPQALPTVMADEVKLEWVILQLLDNAIKFTPNGGAVSIQACHNVNFVRLEVIDTGIGIPEEHIEEIFNSFYQIEGSDSRRFSGTGLGLALSRKILEAHMSHIEINSVVGEGSRFVFSLPISIRN